MNKFRLIISVICLLCATALWAEDIPNNQIWYTSTNGNIVEPNDRQFNVSISTNTYQDGKGVITFDGDLVWIDQSAFNGEEMLQSVTFPASLRTIGNSAFASCTALIEINLNQGLDTIGQSAFYGCTALTEVSIPASVRALINGCFHNCKKLSKVYVNWTEVKQIPVECSNSTLPKDSSVVHNNVFMDIACREELDCGRKYATLYVPVETESLYYKSVGWNKFATIIEDLVNYRAEAIAALEVAKQGVTNKHILAIANDAIDAINNATSGSRINGIRTQAVADITKAKAILNDLPTDPEGTAGTAVEITKGDKSVTLINPDKVKYIKNK